MRKVKANKTKLLTVGASFQSTTGNITAVLFQTSAHPSNKTLKQF